jgi:hypothetical protein
MALYMTKTWGFSVPCGPLQFSKRGWRDRVRSFIRPGDLVAIVGTLDEPTKEDERGMILGLMEPTTEPVMALNYDLNPGAVDYDDEGHYRWPFGLELRAAWRFLEPRAPLSAISSRKFGTDAAQGIVPMLPDEEAVILALRREPIALLQSTQATARIEGIDVARKKAAPPPSTTRMGVMHMRNAPAYTYALEIIGAEKPCFKIGWAFDPNQRNRQFNLASLPALGGLQYKPVLTQLWNTARQAFAMEQALLRKFDGLRFHQNREVVTPITKKEIQDAWTDYVVQQRHR